MGEICHGCPSRGLLLSQPVCLLSPGLLPSQSVCLCLSLVTWAAPVTQPVCLRLSPVTWFIDLLLELPVAASLIFPLPLFIHISFIIYVFIHLLICFIRSPNVHSQNSLRACQTSRDGKISSYFQPHVFGTVVCKYPKVLSYNSFIMCFTSSENL